MTQEELEARLAQIVHGRQSTNLGTPQGTPQGTPVSSPEKRSSATSNPEPLTGKRLKF